MVWRAQRDILHEFYSKTLNYEIIKIRFYSFEAQKIACCPRTIHLLVNIFNLDFRNNSPSLPGHVGYNKYHHSHSEMKQRDNSLDFMDNLSVSDPIQFDFSWPLQGLD